MKFSKFESKSEQQLYGFFCPGCECSHWVQVNPAVSPCWQFNGDCEKPTVSPSVLVNGITGSVGPRCHSFIKDGMIQFLGDCDHSLKGQTVPIPDW